jgi:pyruvate dehydrogenase E2 component (dihydrolipoyllysine-residue acetyltransferase)
MMVTPRHRHSPRARRLARDAGVDLDGLIATGPGGRVTRADITRAAAARATPPRSVEPTCVIEVDVSGIVRLRRDEADHGVPLNLTAFFVEAAVHALRAHPLLNASIDTDGRTIVHHPRLHIGIAVDTDKGLIVPVIRDAGDLSLRGLSRRIDEIAHAARAGTLTPDDLSTGTFTVTNTGSRGALFDTPILVSGQVGILGTGAIVERPIVVHRSDGERAIAIRDMVYLALTYDHRLVDGAHAARFLTLIKQRLEVGHGDVEPW